MSFEGKILKRIIDESLDESLKTPNQIAKHFEDVLKVGGGYNPSLYEVDILEDKTEVIILFRNDSGEIAESTAPYELFITQYEIGDGRFPQNRLNVSEWRGRPCLTAKALG